MKGRLYDPAVGRFLSPDILVQEPEMGMSYNRYSYCLNNPLKYVDPSGWSFTNPTNYVDEFGNTLLNTDDGSQDRIVVPEDMQSDFARFGEMHEDLGMKGMFDNPHWNKHMKSEILGVSSFALDLSLGLYHSQEARQAAIDYMQNPSSANGYNMVWQETKAQYMNPELLVGLASLTLNAGNIASAVRRMSGVVKTSEQGFKSLGAASKGFSKVKIPRGFKHTKQFGYPHGQKVYKYNGKYYSRDIDSHNGGSWKVFKESGGGLERIGTADEGLNIFKN